MQQKLRIKDILQQKEIFLDEACNEQFKIQQKYVRSNQKMFHALSQTLTTRPITFAKFCFKKAEIEQDDQLRPIVNGIFQNQKQGSMLTSELWSKSQSRQFLKQANLDNAKGVLKRFAHWEWDKNSNKERFKNLQEKLKQTTYTNESELITKLQLGTIKGEQRLRQKIIRDWKNQRSYDIEGELEKYKDQEIERKFGIKQLQLNQICGNKSIRHYVKNEKLDVILNGLSSLQEDSKKDKKAIQEIAKSKRYTNRLKKLSHDFFQQD